jgi:hypothetical protein
MIEVCDMSPEQFEASKKNTNDFLAKVFLINVKKVEVIDE